MKAELRNASEELGWSSTHISKYFLETQLIIKLNTQEPLGTIEFLSLAAHGF